MNKDDKKLLRALATELLILSLSGGGKAERYLMAAEAADEVAVRLREKAASDSGN